MENNKKSAEGLETANFRIAGLCSCEFRIIEKRIKNLRGVDSYTLNPITSQLKVTYDKSLVTIEGIQKAVTKAGGKATPL